MIFVHALGTAMIDAGDTRITPSSARRFAMLLYLSAERGRRVSRSALHELICPNLGEKNARHSLRELLYQLRQAGAPILSDNHGVELPAELVQRDYNDIAECDRLSDRQLEAIEGGFLPGYLPTHSEAFAEWYDCFRATTVSTLCNALLRHTVRSRMVGEWTSTERAARACLALDPLNEEATLTLAETLAVAGAKVRAIALLDDYLNDVGHRHSDLRVSAAVLRRRISESQPSPYARKSSLAFVGRATELEFLNVNLDRALRTHAQCVIVHGEPGVGKSRLADEFSNAIQVTLARVERVVAQPGALERPLSAFIELLPRLLNLRGALGCRPESMRALRSLIDVDTSIERTMPDVVSSRIARAIADVIEAITSEQSLVLMIEDAHWLDEASLRLILSLCAYRAPRRLFVTMTSRQRLAVTRITSGRDCIHELALHGLSQAEATTLIDSALNAAGLTPTVDEVNWICGLSLGNPLFITTGVAEYARRRDRSAVPDSLTKLISARLVGLSETALTVLGTTVLLGKFSSFDRLTRALAVGGLQLLNTIRELERTALVSAGDSSISPAHALVSEAFLRQCSPTWLRLAHHQIATVLSEDFSESSAPSLLWECAEHWIAAGKPDRARDFLIRCAEHSSAIGRPDAAASILLRALRLEQDKSEAVSIARRAMHAAHDAGDTDAIVDAANALRDMGAESSHDELELIELWARMRLQFYNDGIEPKLLKCITSPKTEGTHRLNAATLALKYADTRGVHSLAETVCASFDPMTIRCARPDRLEYQMLRALVSNDLTNAVRYCREMLESLQGSDDWTRARYMMNASLALSRCGYHAEALSAASDSLEAAKRVGGTKLVIRTGLCVALLLYDMNRDEEADREFGSTQKLAAELLDSSVDLDLELSAIDVALFKGDANTASTILARFVAAETIDEFRARWIRVFRARIRQLTGEAIDDEDLVRFTDGAMMGPTPGMCDLEIATAAIEWNRRGLPVTARRITDNYVRRRHWKNLFSRSLQAALAEIGQSSATNSVVESA